MNILIADDEFPAREMLKALVREVAAVDEIYECRDGQEAVEIARTKPVDLALLDIHMSVRDGLSAADEINRLENPPLIVFTTGYGEYALEAFEKKAVDYVMKPYSKERLARTFERLAELAGHPCREGGDVRRLSDGGRLPVWSKDRLVMVALEEVLFAKPLSKGKVELVTREGAYAYKASLSEMETCFPKFRFMRVHKSYVVNLERIREIIPWFNSTYMLILKDYEKEKIPVSRHYIQAFRKVMGIEA